MSLMCILLDSNRSRDRVIGKLKVRSLIGVAMLELGGARFGRKANGVHF